MVKRFISVAIVPVVLAIMISGLPEVDKTGKMGRAENLGSPINTPIGMPSLHWMLVVNMLINQQYR